jgi:hypothetical protein
MRMNIQPRVVGERIDYITEEVKYICIQGGRSQVRSISLMPIRQSSFVRLSKE